MAVKLGARGGGHMVWRQVGVEGENPFQTKMQGRLMGWKEESGSMVGGTD